MRGLYSHVSERMRDELREALQARWEQSLRERAALSPASPVPVLDRLLAKIREQGTRDGRPAARLRTRRTRKGDENLVSQISPKCGPGTASQIA